MASKKVSSTALQRLFRHSAYYMYSLGPEKPLRLVYETFYLAIGDTCYEFINIYDFIFNWHDYMVKNEIFNKRILKRGVEN